MIEILILYFIFHRERTIYGIRKDIIDMFGTFTEPSIGTIYPALKRLSDSGCTALNIKMSEGGKKSSYYYITAKGKEKYRELFLEQTNENPSLFYSHLQIRLGTMGILSKEDKQKFIKETLRKIDLYKYELENKINNKYLEPDYYQRCLFDKAIKDFNVLEEYLKTLEV